MRIALIPVLAACLLFSSCSAITKLLSDPGREPELNSEGSYLTKSGNSNQIELGPDQTNLLEAFKTVKEQNAELKSKVSHLEDLNNNLRSRLGGTEASLKSLRGNHAVANDSMERLRNDLRDREAKILSLSLSNARLEQEELKLRIASLTSQIEGMDRGRNHAATPLPSRGR